MRGRRNARRLLRRLKDGIRHTPTSHAALSAPFRNMHAACTTAPAALPHEHTGPAKDAFFRRMAVGDAAVQLTILQLVQQELTELIDAGSPLIPDYYRTVARLARDAPFQAIRETMTQVRDAIQAKFPQQTPTQTPGAAPRVSYFAQNDCIESVSDNPDEELMACFRTEYVRTGRVGHFVQLLAWHKSYLQLYQSSIVCIMVRDGSLPLHWRSYIALMAASELRCHYLADLQQYYFIMNGGDYEWTKGIDYISPKLFRLHELSSLLAHRPWLITDQHIADLLSSDQEDSWSVSELVHAIIVLCQYHSMSSIALGLGCAEEEDLAICGHHNAAVVEKEVIKLLQEEAESPECCDGATDASSRRSSSDISVDVDIAAMERDDERLLKQLKKAKLGEDDGEEEAADEFDWPILDEDSNVDLERGISSRRKDTLWRFCGGSVIQYADFDDSQCEPLHTDDFSWKDHGFSLVRRYFPGDAGQILEDQFKHTSRLTYEYYGCNREQGVDTTPYRHAIWYFVHRIFGICHDDYDYNQVNVYLNRPTKIFIKKVACTPWKVTKDDFEHFDRTLSPSEKCHVTLLAAEARKQAGLMYALRAVMQHMK